MPRRLQERVAPQPSDSTVAWCQRNRTSVAALLLGAACSSACSGEFERLTLTQADSLVLGESVLLVATDEAHAWGTAAVWVAEERSTGTYALRTLAGDPVQVAVPASVGVPSILRVRDGGLVVVGDEGVATGTGGGGLQLLRLDLAPRERIRDFLPIGTGRALAVVERTSTFSLLMFVRGPGETWVATWRSMLADGHGRLALLHGDPFIFQSRSPWSVTRIRSDGVGSPMPGAVSPGHPLDYSKLYSQSLVQLDRGRKLQLISDLSSTRRLSLVVSAKEVVHWGSIEKAVGV